MAAFTQVADEEISGINQLGAGAGEGGIVVDGMSAEVGGIAGKTRPVRYITLYMTAPPYKSISVKETMVPATLGKRHTDKARPELIGKAVFSRTPVHEVEVGHIACLLHPSRPEAAEYRSRGMPQCMTASFASDYEVERHMKNKHHSEWAMIQSFTERTEKDAVKAMQQATLEAMQAQSAALLALAQGSGLKPQVDHLKTLDEQEIHALGIQLPEGTGIPWESTGAVTAQVPRPPRAIPAQLHCEDCDYVTPAGHGAPQFPLGKHRKAAHPPT